MADNNTSDFNPEGLKVLVVDDDAMCLRVVQAMLKRCRYEVVTMSNGREALEELKAKQNTPEQYDLVLSDVYMPDMDGFKLLEGIGLDLEVPVIMMSSDGDTSVVLRGVTHGAVDFLIKPVRIEELRNVWQHVIRRKSTHMSADDDMEHGSDAQTSSRSGKRKENEVVRAEHEGGGGGKKPRVVWSVEMHQQFVYAVNTLGIDKAVPKRILDLMNVEGLTRENVASHLQKYRLYLKRVENVAGGKEYPNSRGGSSFGAVGANGAVNPGMLDASRGSLDVGKPPVQKGRKNSKSTNNIQGMESSPNPAEHHGMHASGSTPNLQSYGTPWMPDYQGQPGPANQIGLPQGQGAYYPMPVYGAPPPGAFGWHMQNNAMGGPSPPVPYGVVTSSVFYQSSGAGLTGPPGNLGQMGPPGAHTLQHYQGQHVHTNMSPQTCDASSTHVTSASFPEKGNVATVPQASDFDSMTAQRGAQDSSGDNSPDKVEKVDLVSEFMRTGSSSVPGALPNLGLGYTGGKYDDHDSDVLNMFITDAGDSTHR